MTDDKKQTYDPETWEVNQSNELFDAEKEDGQRKVASLVSVTPPSLSSSEMLEDNFVRFAKVLISEEKMSEREMLEKIMREAVEAFFQEIPNSRWEGFTPESRIVVENAIRIAFKHGNQQWFDKIVYHPQAKDCDEDECWICAIRDCPYHEPLHYHHDGCPACYGDDYALLRKINELKAEAGK